MRNSQRLEGQVRSCELPLGSPGCLCSSQKPSGKGVRRIFSLTAARALRRGLQVSSPCRGCRRVMGGTGRGPAHRPAGEGAATWQLAQLGGLEVPPPPGSHGGTGSSQGREAPLVLFFFSLPVLFSVECLLPQQEAWAGTPSAHAMLKLMKCWGTSRPFCPLA